MTKRGQWVLTCLLWAALWFIAGLLFFPFWIMTFISLMMILVPVGVRETPDPRQTPDPNEWSKHGPERQG